MQRLLRLILQSMSVYSRLPSQNPDNLYREPFNWRWPAPTQPVPLVGVLGCGDLITMTDLIPGIL